MSQEPIVVIFRERNDVNVCGIPFSSYPTGKVPEVGDKFPLHAEKTFMVSVGGGPQKPLAVKYFDDLVTVVEVWAGKGDILHPTNGCSFYSFKEDLEGYGIRVARDTEKIPAGTQPIAAEVIFGT